MIAGVGRLSAGDYSQRMQEQRQDELGQLTRDIDHLATTLEESQSARRRLLADVSHELRTPLTVLSGEIEALKDGLRAFDDTQLDSLDQEVQRLRHLVNDLYQLSLSDAGGLRYEFASMDLAQCVRDASANLQTRASQAGLSLHIKADSSSQVLVFADVRRIDQLLSNLLENAIAYTDAPGTVEINLSSNDQRVMLRIDDTAPGASESECEQLFEPLYRKESSRTRRSGGAGLGLAICRNIVTAHGGTILAAPSPLGGISIVIDLPLDKENRI
jgi:two-component system sensor histidine kinase BaeS